MGYAGKPSLKICLIWDENGIEVCVHVPSCLVYSRDKCSVAKTEKGIGGWGRVREKRDGGEGKIRDQCGEREKLRVRWIGQGQVNGSPRD